MTGTPLTLVAIKAFPPMKSNYSQIPFEIFLFMYKFVLKEINIIKLIGKMLKQLKKSISDYEIIAQETVTAMSQNILLKCK